MPLVLATVGNDMIPEILEQFFLKFLMKMVYIFTNYKSTKQIEENQKLLHFLLKLDFRKDK